MDLALLDALDFVVEAVSYRPNNNVVIGAQEELARTKIKLLSSFLWDPNYESQSRSTRDPCNIDP